jgi:putative endonuclease
MFYVYILRSKKDGQFYTGFTRSVFKRLIKHNEGGVISTSNRRPFELIFLEGYINKHDALRRERYFKSNPGKKTLRFMLRDTLKN